MSNRLISFDTETTGLDFKSGDRVVEIGAVEILGRSKTGELFQTYLNPEGKEMSEGALEITNISNEQLKNAPKFKDVVEEFIKFVNGAELVIHNAEFDIGFINNELKLIDHEIKDIRDICTVFDTLMHARKAFPGQRNNLNALSMRLGISGYDRTYHGALLDAQILADTYLSLTGGQVTFDLSESQSIEVKEEVINQTDEIHFTNFKANENDISEHNKFLDVLRKKSNKEINW
ncbi:MAG: DNA polymerase III subunit epsilon [Gammaproteobacteria bacterium]|nr:DNA polymerase III subunit epsilon [Gammaproteobacteria bacterium]